MSHSFKRALAAALLVTCATLTGALVFNRSVPLRRTPAQRSPSTKTVVTMIFHIAAKRALDILAVSAAMIVVGPVLLILALLVRFRLGSPVLFKQERPGLYGQIFTIYKFRTMTDERDAEGKLLPDAKRLTRFGKFLRSTSLDELPELLNVLKGDMSLVGPRPLRTQYLTRYTPEQARRHLVKPGITGWAQINGRNGIGWEQKFAHDLWYVDHWTVWLDIKILFLTVWAVVKRDGISQDGHATMPEFMGTEAQQLVVEETGY